MQVSVDEMLRPDDQPVTQTEKKNRYFSLANDGDSAIVRFLHTDINDFEVLDVHEIQLGGFNRKVNCLKTPNGSKDECPICQVNTFDEDKNGFTHPLRRKMFIHMLKYDNPQTCVEQVWERGKDYIKKLHQLVEDYGPLHTRLYKVVRHGAKNSTDTTYDILPLDKDRFNPDLYVFNKDQLNYEKALGSIVLNETNESMKQYLETGNFSSFKGKTEEVTPRPVTQPEQPQTTSVYNANDFSFDGPRRRV